MRILTPMLRNLLLNPTAVRVVDDQRHWKAWQLQMGSFYLARSIQQSTQKKTVGLMLPTSGLFPMALMATWMLGKTAVPLNYLLKREELEYVIDDAGVDLVITVKPMLEMFGEMPSGITELKLDEMAGQFRGFPPLRWPVSRPDDHTAVLLYTSGTSGKPKGVMLTVANLAANVRQCVRFAKFTKRDKILGVLPQFHSFGLTVLTLLPLTIGCPVVYTARFNPRKIVELLREHRPTAFIGIPSMYNALLHARSAQKADFGSLRYVVSGGEPLPEAVFEGFKERFGVVINEGYGLTETGPVTNWCPPHAHKRRSVGPPLPEVEEIIVATDDDGSERICGPNEDGEVRMRGPNIMKGYHNLPNDTAAAFDANGYFRSGDMGRMDEEGHLYITGRYKEMMIIGGENVFPREIEEVLNAHPSVHASAVIGMPDPSRGEVPLAFVELTEGAEFDEAGLRSFCRDRLPGYKVPREIRAVEALPRNPTGKIMRRELKA